MNGLKYNLNIYAEQAGVKGPVGAPAK